MSGQGSVLPTAAIASPVVVGPPSLSPQANSGNKTNSIVLIIVIIAIVVFLVFLFTKLNTQNKQIKELQAKQDKREKAQDQLLAAMAQQMGIRQNEKGEIQFLQQADGDEEDDGEDERQADAVCDGGVCARTYEQKQQPQPEIFVTRMNQLFGAMPMFQPTMRPTEVVVEETPQPQQQQQPAPTTEAPPPAAADVATVAAVD